jgi:hypothetical protein
MRIFREFWTALFHWNMMQRKCFVHPRPEFEINMTTAPDTKDSVQFFSEAA